MGDFDRMHFIIQWGGTLPGDEEWSCSLRMANNFTGDTPISFPAAEDVQEWVDGAVKDAVLAYHTRGDTHISSGVKLTFCKANIVKMDGHYLSPISHEHLFTPTAGGGGAGVHPNQVALVVSLLTGLARGSAHRGRYFLPMPNLAVDQTDGLIGEAYALDVATSTRTFLEALSDTPGVDTSSTVNVVVMSRKSGAPATHKVTAIEVGRVLDTQRRRRRSLPETYRRSIVDFGVF